MCLLRIYILFVLVFFFNSDGYAAPQKRRAVVAKPILAWVKDNAALLTLQQAKNLNTEITNAKDSVKALPSIYVVTQKDYNVKSPFFRAIKSSMANDKWYLSESKDYANDLVILIRPRSKTFATDQLSILCNRNSPAIAPFITSQKIDRLQNEYNKYLNDATDSEQAAVIGNLVDALCHRFFDGRIRDYRNIVSYNDKTDIARLIQNFQDSTAIKLAMITTLDRHGEDSVFRRALSPQKDNQSETTVEYKNLDADLVFVFHPQGVSVYSQLDKETLSDKALQQLTSKYTLPEGKVGHHKAAIEKSLVALTAHLDGDTLLDGMSTWEKLATALLGLTIPAAFCWYIFKGSLTKKKPAPSPKPIPEKKPAATPKPEKKEERTPSKPSVDLVDTLQMKTVPRLALTKPSEGHGDRGWELDNTGRLPVTMTRIDEVFKPISPRNEHEKMMLEMIGYMLALRQYTDQEIARSLGNEGVSIYLDELYAYLDPAAVRIVFNRGLDLLIKNYAERDGRVRKYVVK